MKTAQQIVNNVKNKNIFPLKISLPRQDGWYLGINKLCQTHILQTNISNAPLSIRLRTLAHMLKC